MRMMQTGPTQWVNMDGGVVSVFWDVENVAVELEVPGGTKSFAVDTPHGGELNPDQRAAAVANFVHNLERYESNASVGSFTVMPVLDPSLTAVNRARRLAQSWRDQAAGSNGLAAQTYFACAEALERTLRGAG